ncbi:hypothetical protein [Rudanella paleaurantiibacter]|nr:hypothetical protein [Rudanella paleaurantiibacter]
MSPAAEDQTFVLFFLPQFVMKRYRWFMVLVLSALAIAIGMLGLVLL